MRVALVGSAPSSVRNAPYSDPSWKIIGCSPGVYGVAARVDEWAEFHVWEPGQPWFSPEYVQWLTALPARGVKLWMGAPNPHGDGYGSPPIPGALVPPWKEWLARHDPNRWFCSSSLFWMMCRAIDLIEDEAKAQGRPVNASMDKIALFGVDMAAGEEYEMQRSGCHFIAYVAARLGIEVGAPMESDLFTPRFAYGFDEWTHSFRKWRARRAELDQRRQSAEAAAKQYGDAVHFLKGAIEDVDYMHNTWADKSDATGPAVPPAPLPPLEQAVPFASLPVVTVSA